MTFFIKTVYSSLLHIVHNIPTIKFTLHDTIYLFIYFFFIEFFDIVFLVLQLKYIVDYIYSIFWFLRKYMEWIH